MAELDMKQVNVLIRQSNCHLWAYLFYQTDIIYIFTGEKVICKTYHSFTH